MKYCILRQKKYEPTAGIKAPQDVAKICSSLGYSIVFWRLIPQNKPIVFIKLWVLIVVNIQWLKLSLLLKNGDEVLYQHPSYGYRLACIWIDIIKKRKDIKFVALIHDLESLRKGIQGGVSYNQSRSKIGDIVLLKKFDKIICHNNKMKDYLISVGFASERLITLSLFDYLTISSSGSKEKSSSFTMSICIAGNLSSGKSEYIYLLSEIFPDLIIHLYGVNFDASRSTSNMIYHGSFSPDDLPNVIEGSFGLVWDGDSIVTCSGNTGEYLKYNNPHKTSLYLAAGIPVIVWSEAAISSFIEDNGVGITINSLERLYDTLKNINDLDYLQLIENTKKISAKVQKGFYLKQALGEL